MRAIDADAYAENVEKEIVKVVMNNPDADPLAIGLMKEIVEGIIADCRNELAMPTLDVWFAAKDKLPDKDGVYDVVDIEGRFAQYTFKSDGNSADYWNRCVLVWRYAKIGDK